MTRHKFDPNSAIGKAVQDDPNSAVVIQPRLSPDRIEAALVKLHFQGRIIMASADIVRGPQPVRLEPFKFADSASDKGMVKRISHGRESEEGRL